MMNNSYWNPDNEDFKISCNGKIYVDKSMLIDYTNSILHTPERFICVSRPRRFGKSTDANMLVAYYSKGCDSKALFDHLKIAHRDSYKKHLNKHHVIYLNMQSFVSNQENIQEMIKFLTSQVILELKTEISDVQFQDEWDCIFREFPNDLNSQKVYLDFLRDLLKDKKYVSLAYMTGILPIKKYGTHSALNMFKEISMINPTPMEKFMGFTKEEVKKLCEEYQIDFDEMKAWYDGYHLNKEVSILSPRSVVFSLMDRKFKNYWASTETYESLKVYIDMNFDGLRDDIIKLLARKRVIINPSKFQNDMTTFQSKDDVFTLLVHLGYLGYDEETSEVYIPNNEVVESFVNSIEDSNWGPVSESLRNSMNLIQATYACDGEQVAEYIEKAHLETNLFSIYHGTK